MLHYCAVQPHNNVVSLQCMHGIMTVRLQACKTATTSHCDPGSPSPYCHILERPRLQCSSPASLLNFRKFSIPSTPGTPGSFSNLAPHASPAYSTGAASRFAGSPILITDPSQPPPSPASVASLAELHNNGVDQLFTSELWAAVMSFDCQLDADIEDASKASQNGHVLASFFHQQVSHRYIHSFNASRAMRLLEAD